MGNSLNCLAQCRESQESRQRILFLQIGATFKRKKYVLGLHSGWDKIYLKLSADEQSLQWKVQGSTGDATRIHRQDVFAVETHGAMGLRLRSSKGDTLLEVDAESEDQRDAWVQRLQLLIEDTSGAANETSAAEGTTATSGSATLRQLMEDKAKKQAYWLKRTQELNDRKQEAQEKKQRFASAGLKYTAIAMASRTSSATN